uniref:Uncharacterized protein n=1 Tax=Heterorhabditis bacteriophora TaxID=37862 RepID=A0A1I7WX70_HETBA
MFSYLLVLLIEQLQHYFKHNYFTYSLSRVLTNLLAVFQLLHCSFLSN